MSCCVVESGESVLCGVMRVSSCYYANESLWSDSMMKYTTLVVLSGLEAAASIAWSMGVSLA